LSDGGNKGCFSDVWGARSWFTLYWRSFPGLCVLYPTQTQSRVGSCCQCLCVHCLGVKAVSIGPEHTPPGGQDERKVWHIHVHIYPPGIGYSWARFLWGNCLAAAVSLGKKESLRSGMEKCGSSA
jgi:hypothetical protein